MDNDLTTKWLNAEFMSQTEIRDVLTELQTARDDKAALTADRIKALESARDAARDACDKLSECLDGLADTIAAAGEDSEA